MQTLESLNAQVSLLRNKQQERLTALNLAEQALAAAEYQGDATTIALAKKALSNATQEVEIAQANLKIYQNSVETYVSLSKTTNQSQSELATAAKYSKSTSIIGNTGI